ncbi:hypothetical protein BYT27DRAFT_7244528 [Phlegmacium glaucopus]|nr:hypothetical protein BYT27DRAFT_7244528 [Phlegmacium glaucopus]
MEFSHSIQSQQNIIVSGGSFNDVLGRVHTYNSIAATHCTSSISSGSIELSSRSVTLSSGSIALSSNPSSSRFYSAEEESYLDQNIQQRQPFECLDETTGGAPDAPETEEDKGNAEDIGSDDDRQIKYQLYNCQTVNINSFNARGVKVKDSGNHLPQITHHGGTIVVRAGNDKCPTYIDEGGPPSFAQASNQIGSEAKYQDSWDQPPQYQGVPHYFTLLSPPPPPSSFWRLEGNSRFYPPAQSEPPHAPRGSNPVINRFKAASPPNAPLPMLGKGQGSTPPGKRDKLPVTMMKRRLMQVSHATSCQNSPKIPAPTTPPSRPLPIPPFTPMHTNLRQNLVLPPTLSPFPGAVQDALLSSITEDKENDTYSQRHPHHYLPESPLSTNSSRNPPVNNSGRLEHLLESALETALTAALIIQTSETSSSAEILSPRAQNTLKALNALVSGKTPVSSPTIANETTTRFKSVRKVARWLRIPRSLAKD